MSSSKDWWHENRGDFLDRLVAEQWPTNTCMPPADLVGSVDRDVFEQAQRERLRGNPVFAEGGEAPYRDDRDVMVPGKRGLFQSQFPKWGRHANEDG